MFLNCPASDELHDFYISLLANAISAILRLAIIMRIEVLVKPMEDDKLDLLYNEGIENSHDNNACGCQVDTHATCLRG